MWELLLMRIWTNRVIWTLGAVVWAFCFGISGGVLDLLLFVIYTVVAASYWLENPLLSGGEPTRSEAECGEGRLG